jgi:hypothetical protein
MKQRIGNNVIIKIEKQSPIVLRSFNKNLGGKKNLERLVMM